MTMISSFMSSKKKEKKLVRDREKENRVTEMKRKIETPGFSSCHFFSLLIFTEKKVKPSFHSIVLICVQSNF